MKKTPFVIKIGGHEISEPDFLRALVGVVRDLRQQGQPLVIVHGGGKEISDWQRTLGIEPRTIDGVRVTDSASLDLVAMVLGGLVNKRLVAYLQAAGIDALGMTGVDQGLILARKMPPPESHPQQEMGFTGEPSHVRAEVLERLLTDGLVPVIAPLCLGEHDAPQIYNVNADHVAGAIGAAILDARVVFITNVEGVLRDGVRVERLSADQAEALIADGIISGGMIPKVRTALNVLERGVSQAVITNLHGLQSHGGTVFEREG